MAHAARAEPNAAGKFTTERFFRLVSEGALSPDDRVELLEGVVVAMAPQNPGHAVAGDLVAEALRRAVGSRAAVRVQRPLTTALLIVEVAEWSLPQDRLTKAAIYAGTSVPEYWIVNLRDDQVEVLRTPDRRAWLYRDRRIVRSGERLEIASLPGATVAVAELLPDR